MNKAKRFYGTLAILGFVICALLAERWLAKHFAPTGQPQVQPTMGIQRKAPQPNATQLAAMEAILAELNCICGCSMNLSKCGCKEAGESKGYIRELVEAGDTKSIILDKIVERYGLAILASEEELAKRQPPPGTPQPNIRLSADFHDFGTIVQSSVVSHTFTVENTGDAELVIYKVRSSCVCTTAEISSERIPPGGTAKLTITFQPALRKLKGEITQKVFIQSNDPDEARKTLIIKAYVEER